jgi:hypothetical protein
MQHAQVGLGCGQCADGRAAQGETLGLPPGIGHSTQAGDDSGGEQASAGIHRTMIARLQ